MTNDMPPGIGGAFAFVFGAGVGSFACMVAYRLPRDLSIINTDRFGRYAAHLRALLDAQGGVS